MSAILILVGFPGSGKTTFCKQYCRENPNAVWINDDDIRREYYGDEKIQGDPEFIYSEMRKRTIKMLKEGRDVLFDAPNLRKKDRSDGIEAAKKTGAAAIIVLLDTPLEECLKRNRNRSRTVPESVIWRMKTYFEPPEEAEGTGVPYFAIRSLGDKKGSEENKKEHLPGVSEDEKE